MNSEPERFRLIEHTADIGIVANGPTLAEAFANAAYGMFSIITDLSAVAEAERRPVEIHEADQEALLFEWLNTLLYIFDVEHILFKRFELSRFDGRNLLAECYGERYDPSRHEIKLGVKSATYHELTVDEERHEVRVIFDV